MGNFHSFHLSPRTVQSEVRSSGNPRFTETQISDYGIPKVGDVIDSNSYQIWRIRPSHDFGTSLRILGVPRKILEVPKSHWIKVPSIGGSGSIVSTYIKRGNPSFGGSHQKPRICLPLGPHLQGGGLLYSTKKPWRKGVRGRRSP